MPPFSGALKMRVMRKRLLNPNATSSACAHTGSFVVKSYPIIRGPGPKKVYDTVISKSLGV